MLKFTDKKEEVRTGWKLLIDPSAGYSMTKKLSALLTKIKAEPEEPISPTRRLTTQDFSIKSTTSPQKDFLHTKTADELRIEEIKERFQELQSQVRSH